jgi:hypothetical protein
LDEVKRLKEEKKNYQNQEETRILDEESLNTNEVKLEMQSRIEEGH